MTNNLSIKQIQIFKLNDSHFRILKWNTHYIQFCATKFKIEYLDKLALNRIIYITMRSNNEEQPTPFYLFLALLFKEEVGYYIDTYFTLYLYIEGNANRVFVCPTKYYAY